MAIRESTRTILALLVALTGVGSCGGGGESAAAQTASAAVAPPGTLGPAAAPNERPLVFVGTCNECGPQSLVGVQATLDDEVFPSTALGSDAIVVSRGIQTTTTLGDGNQRTFRRIDNVRARSAVVGTIEWIDAGRNRLGVLGQDIEAIGAWIETRVVRNFPSEPATSLTIAELAVGQRVRVFGFDVERGPISATGVHSAVPGSPDRVTGTVVAIDLAARRLTLGGLSIDYSNARIEGFPGGEVQTGDRVEAVGAPAATSRSLRATALVYRATPLAIDAGAVVDAYGLAVAPSRTRTPGVAPDSVVRVGGELLQLSPTCPREIAAVPSFATISAAASASGLLQPAVDRPSPCRLRPFGPGAVAVVTGTIERREIAAGTLVVAGVTVQAQAATSWVGPDGAAGEAARFLEGDLVHVGLAPSAEPRRGVASYVRRAETPIAAPAVARLQGRMTASGTDAVTFLGRPIRLDAQTRATSFQCTATPTGAPSQEVSVTGMVERIFAAMPSRWIDATVTLTESGDWRAIAIEAWETDECE